MIDLVIINIGLLIAKITLTIHQVHFFLNYSDIVLTLQIMIGSRAHLFGHIQSCKVVNSLEVI